MKKIVLHILAKSIIIQCILFQISSAQSTSIQIVTNPAGAHLFIDKVGDCGLTPVIKEVGPGFYRFRLSKTGYHDYRGIFEVKAGEERTKEILLDEYMGMLSVYSKPEHSSVKINGYDKILETPVSEYKLPVGDYSITISKPNYKSITLDITILENQYLVVDKQLVKTPLPKEQIQVERNSDISNQMMISDETAIEEVVIEEVDEVEVEEIFTIVEDQPSPYGGMAAFYQFVQKKLQYPAQARRMGIEGKVFVQFVVDKEGKLTEIKAVKGIGAGCDQEAERVIRQSPVWKAGKNRGRAVKVRMILPITFSLG